jgi:lipopolysaccharide/colanic/teichoic acid biosynthesis glycosyltransferase
VVIHFDAGPAVAAGAGDGPGLWSQGAQFIEWYCRGAGEQADAVYVLLPEEWKTRSAEILPKLGQAAPLWYGENGMPALPANGDRGQVWLINGGRLPVVDWAAACSEARRRGSDVLIFGTSCDMAKRHYPESVVVNTDGEVVRFKRHYDDSPLFADVWSGEVSFMVTSGENAPSIVNHVLARGWSLESVGVMTRRFSVRWSQTSCALTEFNQRRSVVDGLEIQVRTSGGLPAKRNGHGNNGHGNNGMGGIHLTGLPTSRERSAGRSSGERTMGRAPIALRPAATSSAVDSAPRRAVGVSPTGHNNRDDSSTASPAEKNGRVACAADPSGAPRVRNRYLFWKRTIDLVASGLGLLALSPLLLLVAALIKYASRGPVLFAHKRQGLGGKEFRCLKFRSMRVGADVLQAQLRAQNEVDGPQFKITDDPRLTPLGSWLRRYNIDELPQLINVFLGQMSLVGPRPSPDDENQLCPAWRRTRLSVKPGITGLWQVLRLRNDDSVSDFQEWIYYDIEYAKHQSLWLDLQLLLYTPFSMFAPRRVARLAKRLARGGVCTYAAKLHGD